MSYNTLVYREHGGSKQVVASGGELEVQSGGTLDVQSGATLTLGAALDIDNTITVGLDGTGYDVKFFGDSAGAYMLWDESADELVLVNEANYGTNANILDIDVAPTSATTASRQGAISLSLERATAMTASDGNFDTALKISAKNATASESYARTRGIDVNCKVDNSGNGSHSVHGAYITAEAESGTDLAGELIGLQVNSKQNGDATGASIYALKIYDESQSGTGTNYAVHIDCTNNSAFTREYCIYIQSGASSGWTNGLTFDGNVTNALDFADNDGTNGATLGTHSSSDANPSGHIKVDVGGATRYIYLYTNAVTFS